VPDVLDLKKRTALVTGAGQGVGRTTALRLADNNAGTIIVNDYFQERANSVAQEIIDAGGRALPIAFDVGDFDAVSDMFQAAEREAGPVEILVNNAGNAGPDGLEDTLPDFWETGPDEWERWLRTNLYGVMNCCHAAMNSMKKNNYGRIVTVISDAGRVGEAQFVTYSGAKAGAAGFSRALAKAAGRYGVAVNCVSLAAIMTPGLAARLEDPDLAKRVFRNYVIRRIGEPDDVANAILFLASDAASWITGQTIPVNGGYSFAV
jgi:2-hydroxycyclohexanecarboxyl-CoA dehydrogenase